MLLEPIDKLSAAGCHVGNRWSHLVVDSVRVRVALLVIRHLDPQQT